MDRLWLSNLAADTPPGKESVGLSSTNAGDVVNTLGGVPDGYVFQQV